MGRTLVFGVILVPFLLLENRLFVPPALPEPIQTRWEPSATLHALRAM
jgi:hypothetical protein